MFVFLLLMFFGRCNYVVGEVFFSTCRFDLEFDVGFCLFFPPTRRKNISNKRKNYFFPYIRLWTRNQRTTENLCLDGCLPIFRKRLKYIELDELYVCYGFSWCRYMRDCVIKNPQFQRITKLLNPNLRRHISYFWN